MTWAQLGKGVAVFAVLVVTGFVVGTYLDHYFTAEEAEYQIAVNEPASADAPAACIGADGRWKHWHWANVPALSPKCRKES